MCIRPALPAKRWGLLDALKASNCPPILTNHFDYGAFFAYRSPVPAEGEHLTEAFAPRRIKLDPSCVDSRRKVRRGAARRLSVQEVLFENGRVAGIRGTKKCPWSPIRVPAAGSCSALVAKAVAWSPEYKTGPALEGSGTPYPAVCTMIGAICALPPGNVIFALSTSMDNLSLMRLGVCWPPRSAMCRVNIEKHHSTLLLPSSPLWGAAYRQVKEGNRGVWWGRHSTQVRKPYGARMGAVVTWTLAIRRIRVRHPVITDDFASAEWLARSH